MRAFLANPRPTPAAFRDVVERLLASPRYGEKWGRHWLDVVRYADTAGGSNDFERPNAWRYRDYVIRAFNQDKPYNQFVIEQLAGDELVAASGVNRSTGQRVNEVNGSGQSGAVDPLTHPSVDPVDPLIATGFLRMGPWEHTAMSVEAVTRQQWLDDATGSAAASFLGLTAGCARCHDHKFDPIPTRDYYRLQAVFASTRFAEPPAGWHPSEERSRFSQEAARIQSKLWSLKAKLALLPEKSRHAIAQKHGVKSSDELPRQVVDEAVRTLFGLDSADLERERIYRKWIQLYEGMLPRYEPLAFGVTPAKEQAETFVLQVGQLAAPGEKVTPGVLSAIGRLAQTPEPSFGSAPRGQRLALARWIASAENPLTSRVIVNRVWQWHFGRGLVDTPNNLGKMGGRPSHPELLDWLAHTFTSPRRSMGQRVNGSTTMVRNPVPIDPLTHSPMDPRGGGWSLKALHRLIMASAAYQRSGQHPSAVRSAKLDPDCRLLSRFPPRRLEAEELRDGILAVSGELSLSAGGPGTFPEINEDLARQPRHVMGTIAPVWEPSPVRAERNRRTIYTYQQRSLMDPLVEVFNGANPNDSCERRLSSTVAPQVFALFNSRFSHDMALAFAARITSREKEPAKQVALAFQFALQREPSASELRAARAHLDALRSQHRPTPPTPAPAARLMRKAVVEQTGETVDIEEEPRSAEYEPNLHASQVDAETRALAELCLVLLNTNEFAYVY